VTRALHGHRRMTLGQWRILTDMGGPIRREVIALYLHAMIL